MDGSNSNNVVHRHFHFHINCQLSDLDEQTRNNLLTFRTDANNFYFSTGPGDLNQAQSTSTVFSQTAFAEGETPEVPEVPSPGSTTEATSTSPAPAEAL